MMNYIHRLMREYHFINHKSFFTIKTGINNDNYMLGNFLPELNG
jgi:hypothetical protein